MKPKSDRGYDIPLSNTFETALNVNSLAEDYVMGKDVEYEPAKGLESIFNPGAVMLEEEMVDILSSLTHEEFSMTKDFFTDFSDYGNLQSVFVFNIRTSIFGSQNYAIFSATQDQLGDFQEHFRNELFSKKNIRKVANQDRLVVNIKDMKEMKTPYFGETHVNPSFGTPGESYIIRDPLGSPFD